MGQYPAGKLFRAAIVGLLAGLCANARPIQAGEHRPRCIVVDLYLRGGDAEERKAADALADFAAKRPGIVIHEPVVDDGGPGAARLAALAERLKFDAASTPVVHACNAIVKGVKHGDALVERLRDVCAITVFTRPGCPRCAAAKEWMPGAAARHPGFDVAYVDLVQDAGGRAVLAEIVKRHGVGGASVPVIHACNSVVVGFDRAETTGARIEKLLGKWTADCPGPVGEAIEGDTGDGDVIVEPSTIDVPMLRWLDGTLDPSKMGMPLFTIAVGLVDGFNPCAMWVLLLLLSILVNLKDRWKILAIAGTFVFVSGAAYFAFMAAWLNVFEWIGYLRPVQVALGLLAVTIGTIHVKDFVAFKQGPSLSIPDAAKPGIYDRIRRIVNAENLPAAIAGALLLAVLVNVVELLCTAGLPALYTSILSQQGYGMAGRYGYLLLYILAYMFDDAIMVTGVVWSLSRFKLQETGGRWLKLVSGSVILLLGLVMLFRPEWLG
ncbi:MAG: glutaredoxin family protein [Planctomycetia bacterium]